MMKQEILTMSQKDIKRLHVIQKVVEKSVKQVEAAKVLNLSDRQVRRLQRRVEQQGASGVKHSSCGKGYTVISMNGLGRRWRVRSYWKRIRYVSAVRV
jgi:hypothetical protein